MTLEASVRILAGSALALLAAACSREAAKPATAPGATPMPTPPIEAPDKVENHRDLKIDTITAGTGEELKYGAKAKFLYTGTLASGRVFDSNRFNPRSEPTPAREYGKPTEFEVRDGALIKGWWLGVLGMKVGERRRITVPAHLGYGQHGQGGMGGDGGIPGDATLVFDVELVELSK
jgi:FKBP-type peptidyl-prolyl cis-trans isomerase